MSGKFQLEAIIHLHELGFNLEANVVFEDDWGTPQEKSKLLQIYADELCKLVNYYDEHRDIKPPYLISGALETLAFVEKQDERFCGSGENMVAVDPSGKFYPCHRFAPIGCGRQAENLDTSTGAVKPDKCTKCCLRRICPSCLAYNYEVNGDVNHRTTYHCEFVKLQAKAAARFHYQTMRRAIQGEIPAEIIKLKNLSKAIAIINTELGSINEIFNHRRDGGVISYMVDNIVNV